MVGMLLGIFAGLGVIQMNLVEGRVGASLFIVSLGLFGLAAAFSFVLKKILARREYEMKILRTASKTKDEFISMVLHHLRTPLTGIRWSLKEVLKEPSTTDKQRSKLQKLYDESIRALGAVDHLIEASQASMERIVYNFELMRLEDFQQLAKKNITQLEPMAQGKKLSLQIEIPRASENSIKVDKEKITTIIQTLFENAVAYTQSGGSIKIRVEEKQNSFFFHISDTGMGIPKKDHSRIFLQFFRSENARRLEPGGFGIGLFLVKAFLKHHSGEVWFTSQEDKDTTFSFRLPIITSPTEKFLEQTS